MRGLQSLLSLYGYEIEANGVYDARTEAVVDGVSDGISARAGRRSADESTVETLRRLIARLPEPRRLMKQYQRVRVNPR